MVILLDTGPIVAYLDRSDPAHEHVRSRWEPLGRRFVATGAVITEAMHFLRPVPNGPSSLVALLGAGCCLVGEVFALPLLDRAAKLMADYADTPMDFADATLVLTAEHFETGDILTLDERGFRTFRYSHHKRFRLLLQE